MESDTRPRERRELSSWLPHDDPVSSVRSLSSSLSLPLCPAARLTGTSVTVAPGTDSEGGRRNFGCTFLQPSTPGLLFPPPPSTERTKVLTPGTLGFPPRHGRGRSPALWPRLPLKITPLPIPRPTRMGVWGLPGRAVPGRSSAREGQFKNVSVKGTRRTGL